VLVLTFCIGAYFFELILGGGRETFITGAVDLLNRHSGKVCDPGRFAGFLRGESQ